MAEGSAVSRSPLDDIVEFPFRQREEQELKVHRRRVAEVRNILRRLRHCCRKVKFQWPNKDDLERLDDLVLELFFRIRKRRPLHRWKCYKSVDDYWHLRIWRTLSDLVERAASNTPPRPLEKYDKRLTDADLSGVTKKFLRYYDEVLKGENPSRIKWEQFDELFSNVTGKYISRAVPLTEPKSATYLVFLELFCADLQWTRKHWNGALGLTTWIATNVQHPQMLKKLSRFLIPADIGRLMIEDVEQIPGHLLEKKKDAKRARDRARKRRK